MKLVINECYSCKNPVRDLILQSNALMENRRLNEQFFPIEVK